MSRRSTGGLGGPLLALMLGCTPAPAPTTSPVATEVPDRYERAKEQDESLQKMLHESEREQFGKVLKDG